jgi:hypothetical protein
MGTEDLYRDLVGRRWKYTAYLEDVSVDGSVVLNRIFKKWDGEAWTGLLSLSRGTDGGRL